MLTQNQINNINEHQSVIFTTASKTGNPRSIYVIPNRVTENEIIISNIQMKTSIQNIKENNQCFINVYFPQKEDLQYKIEGKAKVYENGDLFEEIKNYEETENLPPELKVNSIIVIEITNFEESNG